ncbi:BMC domain-containing protein [Desulfosporosinus sp. SB140]|uniref:BMC domain-containing protein n=1 Tax=Desulfosporosinus paludis TaxID=3115649 RepID=UPI00388F09BB
MQALGLIETRGLVPAIAGADVMLKAAQVELMGRTFVGAGLVTIAITGDVGAVKAAVEAAVTALGKISQSALASRHVIPRPDQEIESMVMVRAIQDIAEEQAKSIEENTNPEQLLLNQLCKEGLDACVKEFGLEKSMNLLKTLSVVKLRNLARDYKELGAAGRSISKAKKELLLQKLKGYYEQGSEK